MLHVKKSFTECGLWVLVISCTVIPAALPVTIR
jgi:hypothetical protein